MREEVHSRLSGMVMTKCCRRDFIVTKKQSRRSHAVLYTDHLMKMRHLSTYLIQREIREELRESKSRKTTKTKCWITVIENDGTFYEQTKFCCTVSFYFISFSFFFSPSFILIFVSYHKQYSDIVTALFVFLYFCISN